MKADTVRARRAANHRRGREDRREAIVAAAIAAIEDDGPRALPGAIAQRAGLARAHLYRHFESKEDLDRAIARRVYDDLIKRTGANLELEGGPLDVIREPLTQHVRWAAEHPNLYRFLINRDYRRDGRQVQLGEGPLADELSSAAIRYVPQADANVARRLVVAIMGLVDASVSWWLEHRDTSQAALVDRLTTQIWLIADNGLRQIGIELDPQQTQ